VYRLRGVEAASLDERTDGSARAAKNYQHASDPLLRLVPRLEQRTRGRRCSLLSLCDATGLELWPANGPIDLAGACVGRMLAHRGESAALAQAADVSVSEPDAVRAPGGDT
jgi:hypothetical protein